MDFGFWILDCALRAAVAGTLLCLAGCGGRPAAPEASESEQPETGAQELPQVSMSGEMSFRLFDKRVIPDGTQTPTFTLSSPQCSLSREGVWTFEKATAVIYGRDGEESHIEAGRGELDEANERAQLEGGVSVQSGTMRMQLEDMTWVNEDGMAVSSHPVTITDGETDLQAAAMQFIPKEQEVVLTNVVGTFSLKEVPGQ